MSFTKCLLLAFIILKLMHLIGWSWWLVFTPFYAEIVYYTVLAIAVGVAAAKKK